MNRKLIQKLETLIKENKIDLTQALEIIDRERSAQSIINDINALIVKIENLSND